MADKRRFHIVLETPEGLRSFDCPADENIWDAAAANGIALPAMCHQGRCVSCAARLLAGSVAHDHPDAYFDADADAGFVLLCRALPGSDLRLRTHQAEAMRAHRKAHGLPAPYA